MFSTLPRPVGYVGIGRNRSELVGIHGRKCRVHLWGGPFLVPGYHCNFGYPYIYSTADPPRWCPKNMIMSILFDEWSWNKHYHGLLVHHNASSERRIYLNHSTVFYNFLHENHKTFNNDFVTWWKNDYLSPKRAFLYIAQNCLIRFFSYFA